MGCHGNHEFSHGENVFILGQPLEIVMGVVQGRLNWMPGYKSVTL